MNLIAGLSAEHLLVLGTLAAAVAAFLSWRAAVRSAIATDRTAAATERSVEIGESQVVLARLTAAMARVEYLRVVVERISDARRELFGIWRTSSTFQDHIDKGAVPGNISTQLSAFHSAIEAFLQSHDSHLRVALAGDHESVERVLGMLSFLEEALRASEKQWALDSFYARYLGENYQSLSTGEKLPALIDRAYNILGAYLTSRAGTLAELESSASAQLEA